MGHRVLACSPLGDREPSPSVVSPMQSWAQWSHGRGSAPGRAAGPEDGRRRWGPGARVEFRPIIQSPGYKTGKVVMGALRAQCQ